MIYSLYKQFLPVFWGTAGGRVKIVPSLSQLLGARERKCFFGRVLRQCDSNSQGFSCPIPHMSVCVIPLWILPLHTCRSDQNLLLLCFCLVSDGITWYQVIVKPHYISGLPVTCFCTLSSQGSCHLPVWATLNCAHPYPELCLMLFLTVRKTEVELWQCSLWISAWSLVWKESKISGENHSLILYPSPSGFCVNQKLPPVYL